MNKGRLEAFSDGVLAIVITIMVLEMKAPEDTSIKSLVPIIPVFLSYVLSFIYVAIYWVNHHHLLQATSKINGTVLWANINLLFWISLIPFTTSWMGENHLDAIPIAFYGGVLLMCGASFRILEKSLLRLHTGDNVLAKTVSGGRKEKISIIAYLLGIPLAFVHPFIPVACYLFVAILWIIPRRKLEEAISGKE